MTYPVSIDIVVCTYNNVASLDRVLRTLEDQREHEHAGWHVLVIDNNSTDDTAALLERHLTACVLPLRVVREREQGLTPARVRGVRETDGEWIAFVDDDCLLADDWVAQLAAAACVRPDAGALGGEVALAWEGEPPAHATRYPWAYAQQRYGGEARTVDCLVGAGLVVRRAALAQTGWIERQFLADRVGAKLVSGGDVEIALRVGARHELWYEPGLRLRHVIPLNRTAPRHLTALAYGLGSAKLLGDSMLWSRGYPRWLLRSLRESSRFAREVIQAARQWRHVDVVVTLAFLCGWLAGIWRLMRMGRSERRALLGCAQVVRPG